MKISLLPWKLWNKISHAKKNAQEFHNIVSSLQTIAYVKKVKSKPTTPNSIDVKTSVILTVWETSKNKDFYGSESFG